MLPLHLLLLLGFTLALSSCRFDQLLGQRVPAAVSDVSYIAVVAKVEAGSLPDPGVRFDYHVTGLSIDQPFDTVVSLLPSDTLILPVVPATYQVELENLPAKCVSRYGTKAVVEVPIGTNTAISRFYIECNLPLAVTVFTLGGPDTFQFVWEAVGPGGIQRTGFITHREEVVVLNPLPAGTYTFSVYGVPPLCEITSNGHRTQSVNVVPDGGSLLEFNISCSDAATRPELRAFQWTYKDGVAGVYVEGHDPDYNLIGYQFDITDCNGRSLLPGGALGRNGLQNWHTYRNPDAVIIAALAIGLPDSAVAGRCGAMRLVDDYGNVSPLAERLANLPGPVQARATQYNAVLAGQSSLVTTLVVDDPSGEYAGASVSLELRDGALSPPDGQPDIGVYNNQGFLPDEAIPEAAFGPGHRIETYADVYAQDVYLIDRMGRFTRLVDVDLFR